MLKIMLINVYNFIKLFLKVGHFTIGKDSIIYPSANIINCSKQNQNIIIGNNCHLKGELQTLGHGGRIEIGDDCYVGSNTYIWSGKSIEIGNRVLIGHNCNIFDNDIHPLNPEQRHKQFMDIITVGQPETVDLRDENIIIEDDAWIGANASILKGVKIGKAAIIGTGSVVTHNVQAYSIVAGNSAKKIGEIQNEDYY